MSDPIETTDRPRMLRMLRVVLAGVALEAILLGIAQIAPALRLLVRPLYVLLAVGVLVAVWQAARKKRTGHDRRHSDRREDTVER